MIYIFFLFPTLFASVQLGLGVVSVDLGQEMSQLVKDHSGISHVSPRLASVNVQVAATETSPRAKVTERRDLYSSGFGPLTECGKSDKI